VGETSLTGGDLDRIKTGKLTLTGYLRAGYAAGGGESSREGAGDGRIGYHAVPVVMRHFSTVATVWAARSGEAR
jgi:hypothetical protein